MGTRLPPSSGRRAACLPLPRLTRALQAALRRMLQVEARVAQDPQVQPPVMRTELGFGSRFAPEFCLFIRGRLRRLRWTRWWMQ